MGEEGKGGPGAAGQINEGGGSGVTNFELKTLQAQNEKLRETLVSMRDLSAHEKHQIQKLTKVFYAHNFQNVDIFLPDIPHYKNLK